LWVLGVLCGKKLTTKFTEISTELTKKQELSCVLGVLCGKKNNHGVH